MKKRILKYALSSKSLAVSVGVVSSTSMLTADVINLDLSGLLSKTFIAGGGGSAGDDFNFVLSQSSDADDLILISGDNDFTLARVFLDGYNGAYVFNTGSTSAAALLYYSVGSTINGIGSDFGDYGYTTNFGNKVPWDVDRPSGAIGFKNGDNEFGFINVSWVASTKTLTILGGKFDDTPETPITVTAVPESSNYAAILALGAFGLAYYRKRSGCKN